MRNLQLTDKFTLYGLTQTEYEDACYHIERHGKLTVEEGIENSKMFKDDFKIDLDTIVGDGIFDNGCKSIPYNVAEAIIEFITVGTQKSFKCHTNENWKEPKVGMSIIHEDAHSSINCAINALGHPYGFIITKSDYKRK